MEEQSNIPQHTPPQQEVSFPQPRDPSNGSGKGIKIIIAIVGVIAIIVVGGWFILGNNSGENGTSASPTPVGGLSTFPTPDSTSTPEATSTATPEPLEKSEVKIEVLNGTGTPGEASFLQGELEDAGFSEITAGNADEQGETETTATYSRDLSPALADEITALLEELYEDVSTRRATISGDFDVSITTGPRKGGTATATASPKASATASPSSSPSASPTPTPTSTN